MCTTNCTLNSVLAVTFYFFVLTTMALFITFQSAMFLLTLFILLRAAKAASLARRGSE